MHIRVLEKSDGIIVVLERICESRGKVRSSMICNRGRVVVGFVSEYYCFLASYSEL